MTQSGLDLLGDPVMRRGAVFSGRDRIKLSRDWGLGPRALVIGCNPSTADAGADDPTSRWWNRWFEWAAFGGYDAMNLYPFCTSSPAECRKIADGFYRDEWDVREAMLHQNLPAVVAAAKVAHQVFVCWGAIAWDDDWIEHVVDCIQQGDEPWPDLWCWGTTSSGAPKHPLARGKHRIASDQSPILWRAVT